jgi:phosphatidylinositol 4-phosphatase
MTHKRKGSSLSQLLSSSLLAPTSETTFAAFKALPIDPARIRRASSAATYTEPDESLSDARTCKDAVDAIVESIRRACYDVGGADANFVTESDVVG